MLSGRTSLNFELQTVIRTVIAVTALTALPGIARSGSEGDEILSGFDLDAGQIERLKSGDVLAFSDGQYEQTRRELAADAMVLVDSDLSTVLSALEESTTLIPMDVMIDHALIESDADFAGVKFTADDMKEVEKLFDAKPGKDFNLGDDDLALLEKFIGPHRDAGGPEKIEAASRAMRAILNRRFQAYRESGLDGVDGYVRGRRTTVDVGAELRLTTNTFLPFEDEFPEFIRVMTSYPQGAECCVHQFRWLKVRLKKRPAFALSHSIIQVMDDTVLITERYYYVSAQLNSVQITTAWVPYEDGGYLGLAVSASADILDSLLGRMLRKLGRNMAEDLVTEAMLDIRQDLESRTSSDTGATVEDK